MTMPPRSLTMSPNYLAMVRGVRELHQLSAAGKDDSPEADAIRHDTDRPWESLSEAERQRVRNLSEDFYSLVEPPIAAQPMNPQARAKLDEAYAARQRNELDRALDLLRRWRAYLAPDQVSFLRGSIWMEAGDLATAALFFEHASKLNSNNENYLAMFLLAADPPAARKHAEEVLNSPDKFSPGVVTHAADIEFIAAMTASEAEAQQMFQRLEPILISTLARFEQRNLSEVDRSSYVKALSLIGFSCEFRGEMQAALEYYSRGLQVEPNNDALLVARGILLYGTSSHAVTDLEMAIRCDSSLVWPYVFLAHHYLLKGSFEECRRLCERALSMKGSAAMMSEVSEWMAIAQAELGLSSDMVRASFDNAIRLDPSNERARHNLAAFETATKPIPVEIWETRTASSLRTLGLAKRRYSMAA